MLENYGSFFELFPSISRDMLVPEVLRDVCDLRVENDEQKNVRLILLKIESIMKSVQSGK
ncbi:MAG: hypothetical protein GY841_07245 [FCB group bacterium]|nr:hypothetical protein [FCB group bacterium]